MARSPIVRCLTAATASLALITGGVLTVGGGAVARTGTAHAAPVRAVTQREVLLPTGDTVDLLTANGHTETLVHTALRSGAGRAWTSMRLDTHQYVLPAIAAPYLGSVLDPALFDLASAKAGRVAAVVTHAAGHAASVPGFTATGSSATTSTGYFTAAGARAFGAALAKADRAGAASAPTSLFGATRIASTAGGVARPAFQQETRIFRVTGADGQPLPEGLIGYVNTDSMEKSVGVALVLNGEARVSLPVGHYSSIAQAVTFDAAGGADVRLVTTPDLTVAANDEVTDIDFRTATVRPQVDLPKPSTLEELDLTWDRVVPDGDVSLTSGTVGGVTLEIAPAPAPRHGSVRLSTAWRRTGPAAAVPYRYDLGFTRSGAIPDPFVDSLTQAQLATVHEQFFADGGTRTMAFGHAFLDPASGTSSASLEEVTAPLRRTDYLAAPAGSLWQDALIAAPNDDDPFQGVVVDGLRTHEAGTSRYDDWMRPLVGSSVPAATALERRLGTICPECRSANLLSLNLDQLNDSYRDGHTGYLNDLPDGTTISRMRLYRDGKLVDDEPSLNVFAVVPTKAATYTAVAQTNAGLAGLRLGTKVSTTYTFRSSASSGRKLPSGWFCLVGESCRVLPLLRVEAPLPVDLTGSMATGAHPMGFGILPIQGAPLIKVTAKVAVSFDGGRHFTAVPVKRITDHWFSAVLTNPASSAGTRPTLRFTGTDAAGDTITETVTAAYRVAQN